MRTDAMTPAVLRDVSPLRTSLIKCIFNFGILIHLGMIMLSTLLLILKETVLHLWLICLIYLYVLTLNLLGRILKVLQLWVKIPYNLRLIASFSSTISPSSRGSHIPTIMSKKRETVLVLLSNLLIIEWQIYHNLENLYLILAILGRNICHIHGSICTYFLRNLFLSFPKQSLKVWSLYPLGTLLGYSSPVSLFL